MWPCVQRLCSGTAPLTLPGAGASRGAFLHHCGLNPASLLPIRTPALSPSPCDACHGAFLLLPVHTALRLQQQLGHGITERTLMMIWSSPIAVGREASHQPWLRGRQAEPGPPARHSLPGLFSLLPVCWLLNSPPL